jgi:predicted ATPase
MIYIDSFKFPTANQEEMFLGPKLFVPTEIYPWRFLSSKGFTDIDCEKITILYGSNGSGKSTALNTIVQKIGIQRDTPFNRGFFHYDEFIDRCSYKINPLLRCDLRSCATMITSDDIFDSIIDTRNANLQHELKSDALQDFLANIPTIRHIDCENPESIENYIRMANAKKYAKKNSRRGFIRNEIGDKQRGYSNGETAYLKLIRQITTGLYLLDEPENSLSAHWQSKLAEFIKQSAYCGECQFIIATHSPFILGIEGAKIYNLDEEDVTISKWHELESTKLYYDLFKKLDGKG